MEILYLGIGDKKKEDMIMKNIISNTKMLAALLMAGAAFTACSNKDEMIGEQPVNPVQQAYKMTINASKGEDAQTRGLYYDNTALKVKWYNTDQVTVFPEDWSSTLGTLTAAASATGSTTLTGAVTGASVNDKLNLLFPRSEWSYTGQTGVLLDDASSIEKKYDYATAQVTVNSVDGTTITTDAANLTSQQAIVKFNIKNKATDAALNVTALKISANGGKLVQGRQMLSPTPEGYEAVTGPANYLYIELSEKASHYFYIAGNDYSYFSVDDEFGTGGYKIVGGKYLYRVKTNNDVSQILEISIESESDEKIIEFDAQYGSDSPIVFTNGMYLRQNGSKKVDVVDLAGSPVLTSVYGSLTITPDAATNELTVALRNELAAEDTYKIWATDGVKGYMLTSPSIEFANGNYYEITLNMTQEPDYYAATSSDIGKVIGADGKIYNDVATANASSTAVAMIAYVGNASNCEHGLAIALNDVSDSDLSWESAVTAAAAQTPAIFGGTWRLPTILDWQYMFYGCGDTAQGTPKVTSVIVNKATKLMEKLTAAGATKMKNSNQTDGYWTATENGSEQAWNLDFWDWVSSSGYWYAGNSNDDWKYFSHSVRACLAF